MKRDLEIMSEQVKQDLSLQVKKFKIIDMKWKWKLDWYKKELDKANSTIQKQADELWAQNNELS